MLYRLEEAARIAGVRLQAAQARIADLPVHPREPYLVSDQDMEVFSAKVGGHLPPRHLWPIILLLDQEVYTTGQAGEVIGCSIQTVIRAVDSGLIKGFRLPDSRFRRINRIALAEYLYRYGGKILDQEHP